MQGNINWIASREHSLNHPVWEGREHEFLPLCNATESDSANLDHVAEMLVRTGVEPTQALMVLVPEAYRNHPELVATYPEVHRPCTIDKRFLTQLMMDCFRLGIEEDGGEGPGLERASCRGCVVGPIL